MWCLPDSELRKYITIIETVAQDAWEPIARQIDDPFLSPAENKVFSKKKIARFVLKEEEGQRERESVCVCV